MKKRFLGRLLTMLLVAAMVFTLLPASAIAAAEWWGGDEYADDAATQATEDADDFIRVFHLDCGRKYFSVAQIEEFIDLISKQNYTHMELAVGNDGLRFLLDDMSLTVNGEDYTSKQVSDAIHAGNEGYYSSEVYELTEDDMNAIFSYAKEKNIKIIPLLNTPGHMDAILSAATSLTGVNCSYNGSTRTINVENTTAVAFTKAVLQKYIDYFAGKGCEYFNMGADEYANDIYTSGSMGFGNLIGAKKYGAYITYVNEVAAMIKTARMKPMAFNDGIYFQSNTFYGTFDTDIIICYWSAGYGSYNVAPASTLASFGHKILNTHEKWYYVLGNKNNSYNYSTATSGVNTVAPTTVNGSSGVTPIGCMQCFWCDTPSYSYNSTEQNRIQTLITTFSNNNPSIFKETTPVEPGIVITPDGGTSGSTSSVIKPNAQIKLTASKEVYWTSSAPEVVKLTSADTDVAAQAATYDVYAKSVYATAVGEGTAEILADDGSGNTATYSLTVSAQSTATKTATINLEIGGSDKVTVSGANYKNDVDRSRLDENIATVDVTGSSGPTYSDRASNEYVYTITSNTGTSWTRTGYGYKPSSSNSIYPVYAYVSGYGYSKTYYIGYSETDDPKDVQTIYSGYYYYATVNVYTRTSEGTDVDASTTITFTGHSYGTTYVTVGDTEYTINVAKKTATKTILLTGGTQYYTDNSKTTTVTNSNPEVADAELSGTNLVVTPKAVGTTTITTDYCVYTITVTEEDLDEVTPLTVELWNTNRHVLKDQNSSDTTANNSVSISASDAYDPNGVLLSDQVIATGYNRETKQEVVFWKGTRLLSSSKQTESAGDDKTSAGNDFAYIRYWGGNWSFSADRVTWTDFNTTTNYYGTTITDQVVAYYLQTTDVTDEVETRVADWGTDPSKYTDSNYVILDFAVKYQDGTITPSSFPAAGKTQGYHCNMNTDLNKTVFKEGSTYYRRLGAVYAKENADYEVYMITLTPTSDSTTASIGSTCKAAYSGGYSYSGTEKVVWVDDEANLGAFSDTSLHHADYHVGGAATVPQLKIYNKQGLLVTYYVRARITEDSLRVNYYVEGSTNPFYGYNIAVKQETYFNANIGLNDPWKGPLANGTVTNLNDKVQTVSANLSTMPAIGAQYRYSDYECVRVEAVPDADGHIKTVNLYYTFSKDVKFVVDFTQPITIKVRDLNSALANATITNITVANAEYGTAVWNNSTDDPAITYTPTKTFDASIEQMDVTVEGTINVKTDEGSTEQKGKVEYQVFIYPASNVLYEEGFLAESTTAFVTGNRASWNLESTTKVTSQQIHKTSDATQRFGFDTNYEACTGRNGAWVVSGMSADTNASKALTTTFYGNAIDIIGSCAPNSGKLMAIVKKVDENKGAVAIVDTRYKDTIEQVPLAHLVLDDADAAYTVTLLAYYQDAATISTVATQSLMRRSNSVGRQMAADLAALGLSMSDVQYYSAADAVATMSLTSTQADTIEHEAGTHVEIDGFRVYRSTASADYIDSEKNIDYRNILDVVNGKFVAYTETNDAFTATVKTYENAGGPQNEIYLANGQSVMFGVDCDSVQVSLRAVSGKTSWANSEDGDKIDISSNTEMYYTVNANNGVITIMNRGNGLLAIGNVKLPDSATVTTTSELSEDVVVANLRAALQAAPSEPDQPVQPDTFTPDTFKVNGIATNFFRHKIVTLRVTVSKDVDYVTINDVKYQPNKLMARIFGYSTITITKSVSRGDNGTYTIIAYNNAGTASASQIWSY